MDEENKLPEKGKEVYFLTQGMQGVDYHVVAVYSDESEALNASKDLRDGRVEKRSLNLAVGEKPVAETITSSVEDRADKVFERWATYQRMPARCDALDLKLNALTEIVKELRETMITKQTGLINPTHIRIKLPVELIWEDEDDDYDDDE